MVDFNHSFGNLPLLGWPFGDHFYILIQSVGGHLEVVQELVNAGADVGATTVLGGTALWWARQAHGEDSGVVSHPHPLPNFFSPRKLSPWPFALIFVFAKKKTISHVRYLRGIGAPDLAEDGEL